MANERIVLCEACGSEGRIYKTIWLPDRHTGVDWHEVDTGPCPYCEGTGGEIIETQPIDEDDLDVYAPLSMQEGHP